MTVIVSDTFVETVDTAIGSHTPDIGTSWTPFGAANVLVVAAADYAQSSTDGNGHRVTHTGAMPDVNYDISGDFPDNELGNGSFWGLRGRENNTTTATGLEFVYDVGIGGGSWNLGADSFVETYPASTPTLLLAVRAGTASGKVNGVTKVTTTSDPNPTNGLYVGFLLGVFNSSIVYCRMDNFVAETVATVPAAVSNLAGTAGNAQVPLTWTAPADGDSPITDYVVQYREA